MIYTLSTVVVIPGKMAEYDEIASKELRPLYPKLGMTLVGSWHSFSGNMNERYSLYSFNSIADIGKSREAQRQSQDYQKVSAKLNALRVSQTSTILEPNPGSPMK